MISLFPSVQLLISLIRTHIFRQIHQENEQKISSMSAREISEAQQDVLKSLDPSLVNMLRNRKSRHSQISATQSATQPPSQSTAQPATQTIQTLQPASQSIQKELRFTASDLEPQPLKKLSSKEKEEQKRKKLDIRKMQQEGQKAEMLEQFEETNKSIILMAEGPQVNDIPSNSASTDVGCWRFDFEGNLLGIPYECMHKRACNNN